MPTLQRKAELVSGARDYIRPRGPRLRHLPESGKTWDAEDIPDAMKNCLQRLQHLGVIKTVDRHGSGLNLYETTEQGWAIIEEYAERDDALLCEHGGIKNLGDGLYTCADKDCDHKYSRDTIGLLLLNDTIS
jgi:hypothetical protein